MTGTRRLFAKKLRRNMTDAERCLWRHLRAHRFTCAKFKRQQPIGPYIVDFVCFDASLVIEVDGGQHLNSAADQERDAWLKGQGFQVLRFWNDEVLTNLPGVLERIGEFLYPSPRPSPTKGEGV
jgi:very-short-patch-repair endonuclease